MWLVNKIVIRSRRTGLLQKRFISESRLTPFSLHHSRIAFSVAFRSNSYQASNWSFDSSKSLKRA